MKNRRLYLFPVTVFSLAFCLRVVYFLIALSLLNRYPDSIPNVRQTLFNFWEIFWPLLFITEIIIYTRIRNKLVDKTWVKIHSWTSLFTFLLMPISYSLFIAFYPIRANFDLTTFKTIAAVRRIVFWSAVVIGHLFFILTIVKSASYKPVHEETAGLLDEFIS